MIVKWVCRYCDSINIQEDTTILVCSICGTQHQDEPFIGDDGSPITPDSAEEKAAGHLARKEKTDSARSDLADEGQKERALQRIKESESNVQRKKRKWIVAVMILLCVVLGSATIWIGSASSNANASLGTFGSNTMLNTDDSDVFSIELNSLYYENGCWNMDIGHIYKTCFASTFDEITRVGDTLDVGGTLYIESMEPMEDGYILNNSVYAVRADNCGMDYYYPNDTGYHYEFATENGYYYDRGALETLRCEEGLTINVSALGLGQDTVLLDTYFSDLYSRESTTAVLRIRVKDSCVVEAEYVQPMMHSGFYLAEYYPDGNYPDGY